MGKTTVQLTITHESAKMAHGSIVTEKSTYTRTTTRRDSEKSTASYMDPHYAEDIAALVRAVKRGDVIRGSKI